jgi:Flp pilus assembly protein TadD
MRVAYARLLAQDGRTEEAEKEYREAVRLDPNDPSMRFALARFLAGAGRKDEARKEAETVLALKPTEELRRAVDALLKSLTPSPS